MEERDGGMGKTPPLPRKNTDYGLACEVSFNLLLVVSRESWLT